ncbi:alpha/beta fold hydrolase [Dictyobacter aurantiacus]|uniref:AB hydrolase-1 domain-containing protein n=1 Tax=Dictyobacter aurantiacus TaxID=1936993 RepID=A0A401ZKB9_9CHLR|nr:alpha/beta hydrolase [Dictyobacter aurantiacus]GCE07270.1 hypothetical protein KDAU_45990 [Dictyobacter aurantiacus]
MLVKEVEARRGVAPWIRPLVGSAIGLGVMAAGAGALYQVLAEAKDRRRYPPPGRLIDVGGHRLHYLDMGKGGPTVVLDSGLGCSMLDWCYIQPAVARFTRVCAYDRAGYGWSEPGPKPRSAGRIVDELLTLLRRGGIPGPYVLVGHSLGGLHMQLFARRHPELVAGLVLIDASPLDQRRRVPRPARARWLQQQLRWQLFCWSSPLLARIGVVRLQKRLQRPKTGPTRYPATVQPIAEAQRLRSRAFDWTFGEARAIERSEEEVRTAPAFPPIPLIVLAAENSSSGAIQQLWLQLQGEQALLSPESSLRIVKQSGHFIQIDQPDSVIQAIRDIIVGAGLAPACPGV